MPDEQIDVFLSYTRQNDTPPPGVQAGWVTTLRKHLEAALALKLPRPGPRVFQDHELLEHVSLERQLLEKVRMARTLVLTLSPAYVDSVWCTRELANFLAESERSNRTGNAFVVEIDRVDPQRLPKNMEHLLALRFWQEDSVTRVRETLGYPTPTLEDREYHRLVNRLAHRIAELLIQEANAIQTAARKPTVYVAEPTEDLLRKREQILELIEAEGFEAVPGVDLPRDSEPAFVDAVTRAIAPASLCIQLFGPEEGRSPVGGHDSFVRLQSTMAFAQESSRGMPVLQWRDARLSTDDVENARYRELVFGHRVQASRLEEFKLEILRALRSAADSPTVAATPQTDDRLRIVIKADTVDHALADDVEKTLRQLDVAAERLQAGGDANFARALADEAARMASSHGVIFVQGQSTTRWLESTYMFAARAMGLNREDEWGALVDATRSSAPAASFTRRNLTTLDCRAGIQEDTLNAFVEARRRARGDRG